MPEIEIISKLTSGSHIIIRSWPMWMWAQRLERITGIPPEAQSLQYVDRSDNEVKCNVSGDVPLGMTGIESGWKVYVYDTRPTEEQLDLSESDTPKYEMPRDEYENRKDTLLQWKKDNHLGRFSEQKQPSQAAPEEDHGEVTVSLDSECFVRLASGKTVRGTVAFIGEVPQIAPGTWIGARLLSPDGKHDGTVKGVSLFSAEPNHGVLVRPSAVRPVDEDEEEL